MSYVQHIISHQEELRKSAYQMDTGQIDYVAEQIAYDEFFTKYLIPNKPCHLGPWLTSEWKSRKRWVTGGKPNEQYLKETFSTAVKCPVANCNQQEYDAHCKSEIDFEDYMNYLHEYSKLDYPKDKECFYLKDWHFTKVFPKYGAYTLPLFFESDWLNEFLDEKGWEENKYCDDYRFVYIGPKGSWTPFHSDVLRSHSWSANICGAKLWVIFPPGEEDKLRDRYGHLPFDINAEELKDESRYPHGVKDAKRLEIVQREGEVIFVPSGWHHQVMNIEDTISINHNWSNGCNVDLTWQFLCTSLHDVQQEISDCKGMDGWNQQCQLILKASCGVDYLGFYNFLAFIALKRLSTLKVFDKNSTHPGEERSCVSLADNSPHKSEHLNVDLKQGDEGLNDNILSDDSGTFGDGSNCQQISSPSCFGHVVFDLKQIYNVLEHMFDNKEFLELLNLDSIVYHSMIEPNVLLDMLKTTIKSL